ncbi:uncharacterized protein LOC126377877 isoform X3 [Pectinophora gossypiella]|uniref:uncharacterized protein LOC126377877 isoform X3 n=1 Tax=Pectinophora gossypiella TaxID=13191 RepID=UPI00214F11C4|nr:uncharacterized protein LOC126377877 isoform X3 [Pectinophora gossypiella]
MESQPGGSRQSINLEINSPRKKREKRTYFTSNEKQMVVNMHKYVKQTWPTDEYPYKTSIMEKTASILGIGVASVYRIIKEYATFGNVQSPSTTKKRLTFLEKLDECDKQAIRKKIHSFYLKSELPTLKKVLQAVNDDEELPNFKRSTFQKLLKHLKYDLELNSDDKLSDDDALATFPSQPRQAPIASSSAGGGEDPRDDERCDSCRGGLSGIRLVCVQCSYSHCVACETSGRHRHHYMLRVPANGQKKVLERLVKIIQTELPEIDANYKSDADPSDEPLIIKTEIKTEEEEPDPLGEATIYTEQLRPEEVLEQTMLEIDKGCLGQVVDPPPAPAMQATTSAHPATNIIPTTGASVASKRRASSPTQPSAPKKVTSPQQYKTDPWTHQDDIDPHTPGEISIKTETSMPDMKGRGKKGRTTKKKVKQ